MKKKEWEREEFCFLLTFVVVVVVVVGVSWKFVCAQRKCIYLSTTWTGRLMKWPPLQALFPLPPCPFLLAALLHSSLSLCRSATVGALIDESAAGSMNIPRLTVDETKKNPTRSGLAWCYFWEFSQHDFLSTSPRFRLFMLNTSI